MSYSSPTLFCIIPCRTVSLFRTNRSRRLLCNECMESHRRTERCQKGSALNEDTMEELKYLALLESTPLAGFDDSSLDITEDRLLCGAAMLSPCHCNTLWGQRNVEMSFVGSIQTLRSMSGPNKGWSSRRLKYIMVREPVSVWHIWALM